MQVVSCYYCDSSSTDPYAEENGYSLVECRGCGLLYIATRPNDDQISEAAKQGKHSGDRELDVTGTFRKSKVPRYKKVLDELFVEGVPDGRWFDIGCGHGEFMHAVREWSVDQIEVIGSEPNVHKAGAARGRGLDVSFVDPESHAERYDYISLLNVFSHLPDPPDFLSTVASLLSPGGQLILQTGDTMAGGSLQVVPPLSLPDHLSFASEEIVVGILERLGFATVKVVKYPALTMDLMSILREAAKLVLPQHESRLGHYVTRSIPYSDMYIRAVRRD